MQYSPKLKMAMGDIKVILEKYDIGGSIVLHTPGHSEYLLKINPSYSCAKFEGDHIRVKAKVADDFGGDKEAQRECVANTSNMLSLLSEVGGRNARALMEVSRYVDEVVGAEHTDKGHSSNTQQNN